MNADEIAMKMQELRTTVVETDTVAQLSYQFEQLLLRRRAELAGGNHVEANGIVVMGKAGSGKTFAVEHVIGALQGSGVLGMDEVYSFITPSPATLKLVGWDLLTALGYEVQSPTTTAGAIWQRVRAHLQRRKALFLVIDEAHDLLGRGSRKEKQDVINTLKSLMQQRGWPVSLILIGVSTFESEPGLEDLLSYDTQLARRLKRVHCEALDPIAHESTISDLIVGYAERAGVPLAPEIATPELSRRLLHAVGYQFGMCMILMLEAIEVAMFQSQPLSPDHFATAYTNRAAVTPERNPFWAQNYREFDAIAAIGSSKLGRR